MIVEILKDISRLDEIKRLWRANAATLGFFPDGAFQESASKGCILVAQDRDRKIVGYLLFRKSGERLAIVHLCVSNDSRRSGIAKALFDNLRSLSQSFRGITVSCRRDFTAASVWPKLGFVAIQEKRGRGAKDTVLTNWWFDSGNPDLFSLSEQGSQEKRLSVVVDANAFYDFDKSAAPDTEESQALLADWMQAAVELRITPETLNEINRHGKASDRKRNRERTGQFSVVRARPETFSMFEKKVKRYFPAPLSESDTSDIRQLAWTIAAGHRFFVTRDERLLGLSASLYREFGITVIRPSDLIVQIDELQEGARYSPARIGGELIFRRLQRSPNDAFVRALQASDMEETKAKFRERLCKYLARPRTCQCWGLFLKGEKPAALVITDRTSDKELLVPFLRVARGPESLTILRSLLLRLIKQTAEGNRNKIVICDPYCTEFVQDAYRRDGFRLQKENWIKQVMPRAVMASEFMKTLKEAVMSDDPEGKTLDVLSKLIMSDPQAAQKIERTYWPLKIVDAPLPTYVVPIQPQWAAELFDDDLANQDLFGARTALSLNREGVYYRSAKIHGGLSAPARILWYVSEEERFQGSKSIRACSFLDAVVIGPPKELFRRFERLGVYEWKHVIELAKGDVGNQIMAIQYSDTQLLAKPVAWRSFQPVLKEAGIKTQLQSPQLIPPNVFAEVYRQGMGYEGEL